VSVAIELKCHTCGRTFSKGTWEQHPGLLRPYPVKVRVNTTCPQCGEKCQALFDYPHIKCCFCKKPASFSTAVEVVPTVIPKNENGIKEVVDAQVAHPSCATPEVLKQEGLSVFGKARQQLNSIPLLVTSLVLLVLTILFALFVFLIPGWGPFFLLVSSPVLVPVAAIALILLAIWFIHQEFGTGNLYVRRVKHQIRELNIKIP
jgi:hypothetical protein